jgi:hypothetical protein
MSAESTADDTDASITKLRFHLDGLTEYVKRIWVAMHDPNRGPEDYPPWEDERRILVNIIRDQTKHGGGNNYTEGGGNSLKSILIGVAITVVSSVILGSWYISYRLGLFESQVTEWQRQTERRLDALERRT